MKIYLNDRVIFLRKKPPVNGSGHAVQTKEDLSSLYLSFEADPGQKLLALYAQDYKQLKKDFLSLFTIVIAAGGLVKNEKNEILFIFRRGHWDLPKGKLNKTNEGIEKKKKAALREVMEETGIKDLDIVGRKGRTSHIFFDKKVRYLKRTFWYEMRAPKDQPLKPQTEEDITEVRWIPQSDTTLVQGLLYPSLRKLIKSPEKPD